MMTSSNGKISALLTLCEGNPPVTGGFPWQRQVTRNVDISLDLHLDKRLSKQSRRRWFEMPSCSLWLHCNDWYIIHYIDDLIMRCTEKFITSYKQMMIIMKITMMIMMMIMWGLYDCNLLSHMYMWHCKCQNVTHLNSWSSIATQSLTYADTAPGILQT